MRYWLLFTTALVLSSSAYAGSDLGPLERGACLDWYYSELTHHQAGEMKVKYGNIFKACEKEGPSSPQRVNYQAPAESLTDVGVGA
jgi:hypothetical protein